MVAFKPKAGKLPYSTIPSQLFQIISSRVIFTDFSRKIWEVLPVLLAVSGLYFFCELREPNSICSPAKFVFFDTQRMLS